MSKKKEELQLNIGLTTLKSLIPRWVTEACDSVLDTPSLWETAWSPVLIQDAVMSYVLKSAKDNFAAGTLFHNFQSHFTVKEAPEAETPAEHPEPCAEDPPEEPAEGFFHELEPEDATDDEADAVTTRDEPPSLDEQHRLLLARCLELRLLRQSDGGWHPGIIGHDLALSSRSNCVHCKTQVDATTGKIEKGSGRWRCRLAQRGRPANYLHLECTHSIVDRTQIENSVGFLRERISAVTDATERAAMVEAVDLLEPRLSEPSASSRSSFVAGMFA